MGQKFAGHSNSVLTTRVLDYAVSFMWQSGNLECAGAHINRDKTHERTGLNQGSFNSLVLCTFNNAPGQKPDTPRLVSKWRADGHNTRAAFGFSEEDGPKVMKRILLKSNPPRFLLSKEEALASYVLKMIPLRL